LGAFNPGEGGSSGLWIFPKNKDDHLSNDGNNTPTEALEGKLFP
jgi:hypothetical protein